MKDLKPTDVVEIATAIHGVTNLAMATQSDPRVVDALKNLLQETLERVGMTTETFFSNW